MSRRGTTAVAAGVVSGGVTSLVFTLRAHELGFPLWQYYHTADAGPVLLAVLLGAVPAVAFVRYGLLSPSAILALVLGGWLRLDANPLPGEPVLAVLTALVASYVLAMVLFAWFEFSVRSHLRLRAAPN